ncbi:hypothetical protein BV898_11695 [Hypsibius exemplaris]|uniref:Uncharacterized protein n=1 Tax=Hypsibius exemplaris TaxID=2072580 RepID=A0A1W0WFX6_HYPEX|nr:hypothetical protein BV898_11695 [Hypsibius exemplaris]
MVKIDQRPIAKPRAPLFPSPHHRRNLFGAQKNCPKRASWLKDQIAVIHYKNVERARAQWGFDVENGSFLTAEKEVKGKEVKEEEEVDIDMRMEVLPAVYEPVVMQEEPPLAPIFTLFSAPPLRRTLSNPSAPPAKKKTSSTILSALTTSDNARPTFKRTYSVQSSLLDTLSVRKNGNSSSSTCKKLDGDIRAGPSSTVRALANSPRGATSITTSSSSATILPMM